FSTSERRCIMGSVIAVSPGSSVATQAYPKITVTTSNPSYTTPGDTILFPPKRHFSALPIAAL
ncbi:MAG: hypothetical protein KGJ57_23185, partial [Sphingomonadales bacterium]|nr:hypothetical protein [Sphingomonadales bacterium]